MGSASPVRGGTLPFLLILSSLPATLLAHYHHHNSGHPGPQPQKAQIIYQNGQYYYYNPSLNSRWAIRIRGPAAPPPATPAIPSTQFFGLVSRIPMLLYSSYMCGLYNGLPSLGRKKRETTEISADAWADLSSVVASISNKDLRRQRKTVGGNTAKLRNKRMTNYQKTRFFNQVRGKLRSNLNDEHLDSLDRILVQSQTVRSLTELVNYVYGSSKSFAWAAKKSAGIFYVNSTDSSEEDEKTLLADVVCAANGRVVCTYFYCRTNFRSADEVEKVVLGRTVPPEMGPEEKKDAVKNLQELCHAGLTSDSTTAFLESLVPEDYIDEETDGLERRKRSTSTSVNYQKALTCYLLYNYMRSSRYCGVLQAASVLFTKMGCYNLPDVDNPTAPPPVTTTTTTQKPTTTTTSTTSTTSTSTTTTPKSATTSATTSTTTTKPTTTSTTTTTTTAAVVTLEACGVSDIATSTTILERTSDVFIQSRIVGGKVVGQCSVYPWMVRLTINNGQVCGGVILDATHILTAAHCAVEAYSIQAVVGEYDTTQDEGTEQKFTIDMNTGVSIHPDFDKAEKTNDVAVLTLDEPIDLNQPCATAICLDPDYSVKSGESCTVAGWGTTSAGSRVASPQLQSVNTTVFQGTDCSLVFPRAELGYFTDPENQLCAGQPAVGGVDACQGDSGGPLFCLDQLASRWVVVGVVSYGKSCALADYPGVYASVEAYYDWITAQLV